MKTIYSVLIFPISLLLLSIQSKAQSGILDSSFANDGIFTYHHQFASEKAEDIALTSSGRILILEESSNAPQGHCIAAFTSEGIIDSSFGVNGLLFILEDDYATLCAIAIDTSDRILVLAQNNDYYNLESDVYRFLSDGSPDTDFGNDGEAKTKFEFASNTLLIQPDGKIVVAGWMGEYDYKAIVERFNENGSVDASFSGDGFTTLDYGLETRPFGINQDTDGRLLITGQTDDDLFLTRLLSDGTPDNAFSGVGYLLVDGGATERGNDVAIMQNGNIAVAGYSAQPHSSSMNCWMFLDDGSADISFGNGGLVKLDSGAYYNQGLFVLPDGSSELIIGGSVYNGRTNEPHLYRLLDDGSKDLNFGNNGLAGKTYSSNAYITTRGVRTFSGNILVCGTKGDNGNNQSVITQFLEDGSTDLSFGTSGTSTTKISNLTSTYDEVSDLTVLEDGRIICAGQIYYFGLALMDLTESGVIDSSFGKNGILIPDGEGYYQHTNRIIAADQNQIYIAMEGGHGLDDVDPDLSSGYYSNIAVLKLLPDGSVDSTFGVNGVSQPTIADYLMGGYASIAVQQDGKVLLTGEIIGEPDSNYANGFHAYLIRLNQNGSLDSSFGNNGFMKINYAWRDGNPSIATTPDGKIIYMEVAIPMVGGQSIELFRMLTDGSLDPSFGINGELSLPVNNFYGEPYLIPVKAQSDKKILLDLYNYTNYPINTLLRLNEDGSIDDSFGINGYSDAINDYDFNWMTAVEFQSDQKILCGGTTASAQFWDKPYVVRCLPNGVADSTFGMNGMAECDSATSGIFINNLKVQPDDKILLMGQKSLNSFYVARLLNDASTGIENLPQISSIALYPNPTTGLITIDNYPMENRLATLVVTDMIGQIVMEQQLDLHGDGFTFDVMDFTPGMYMLSLKTNTGATSAKFIKE